MPTLWLDIEAAAAYLDTNARHMRRLVARDGLPHVRLGPRLLRFDRAELDRWLRARHQPVTR